MAYIVSTTTIQVFGSSHTVALDSHVANDLLLVAISQDGGSAAIATSSAGWQMIGTQNPFQASRMAFAYKVAASAAEPSPIFTGQNDDTSITTLVIRGADTATPIEGWMRSDWGNGTNISTAQSNTIAASSAGGTTLITSSADALVLYGWCSDWAGAVWLKTLASETTLVGYTSGTGVAHTVCMQQRGSSAGAPQNVTMYSNWLTEGGNGWVLSIKTATGAPLQAQLLTQDTDEFNEYGPFGQTYTPYGTSFAPNTIAATIAGITCSANAGVLSYSAGFTNSGFGLGTQIQTTDSVPEAWCGSVQNITAKDMSGKTLSLIVRSPTDARALPLGAILVLSDGTNWVAYQIASRAGFLAQGERAAYIKLGSATPLDSSGTVDFTAITKLGFFYHRGNNSATAGNIQIKYMVLFGKGVLTGGGAALPASFQGTALAFNGWGFYRALDVQGSSQILSKIDLQIGDGVRKTYFDASASSTEYPAAASWAKFTDNQEWNVHANQQSITVKASANDTIKLTACVIAASVQQAFTIDPASSTAATYSFAGLALIGFLPTWKTGVPCNGVTFQSCDTIDFKGTTVTGVTALSGTGTALCSATDGFSISNSSLTASATAAYGIRIPSAGAYAIGSTSFSGFTKDIDVTATTGTVTLNLALGQATPTYQTAGATVVFVAVPTTTTITAQVSLVGAEVRIYDLDNSPAGSLGTELAGVESCPTATFDFSIAAGNSVWVQIMLADYKEFGQQLVGPSASTTYTMTLVRETNG